MNEKNPHNEDNVERLIQAGFDKSVRPDPAVREQAWKRVKAAWRSGQDAMATTALPSNSAVPYRCEDRQSESRDKTNNEQNSFMSILSRNRWGLGLSAAAGLAAVIGIIAITAPKAHATAVEVMARGAKAVSQLTSIHLKGQLRAPHGDNFSAINANMDFQSIELWKQLSPDLKWRVEKPGRVALMDGSSSLLYIQPPFNMAAKVDGPSASAFDTDWLHCVANLSLTISNELRFAQARGWNLELAEETAADGSIKDIVTVHAKAGLPDEDYMKNKALQPSDTRRVYRFDDKTELLEGVQFYLVTTNGEIQVFELTRIDYNQPIDTNVWHVELPANVKYAQEPQKLADNDRYASMTSDQAARAFFEACGREDWAEVGKFISPVSDRLKEGMKGLKIVSIGQPFTSQSYAGQFVPYEIKLPGQICYVRVANTNAAKRFVLTGTYDKNQVLQQDFQWSEEPEVLPANDPAVKLSAAEVVQAYFKAQAKLDWTEMAKFTSKYDVETTKQQVDSAQKQGVDLAKRMPEFELIESVWSPEQNAYFVKGTVLEMGGIRKHNLALRRDNAARRWQVDGGF